ncbi:hypothetical protein PSTG_05455 [Puccinia striiformis f. sp. tritici PST-78]|uniref:Uncharacterized protein n=1 Tax=Puccinia striiformis f. sp. tritici PST-78 TaxID=1165861 RepID=A0A0L0VQR3_9BASI|nr:hypothetical protein PSTG_05455 [Puccinia striiformis f. sp. tritici PST-78]
MSIGAYVMGPVPVPVLMVLLLLLRMLGVPGMWSKVAEGVTNQRYRLSQTGGRPNGASNICSMLPSQVVSVQPPDQVGRADLLAQVPSGASHMATSAQECRRVPCTRHGTRDTRCGKTNQNILLLNNILNKHHRT